MNLRTRFCLGTSLALAAAASFTQPVFAQDAPVAKAVVGQDDIVVTARRRAELQQDVPLAVSALSSAQLERQAVTNVSALSGKVPSLIIDGGLTSGRSTPVFSIRGQSQQDLTALSDPSVSLYVNEVVVPRPLGANVAFFDLSNVQVLRGPQGTLFGRNTPGGAVIVTPHGADPDFGASIAQTIASYGTYNTELMLNAPVTEALSFRVAGVHNDSDGYIHDVDRGGKEINTVDESAGRITIDFHPDDRFTNVLTAGYAKSDNGGTGSLAVTGLNGAGSTGALNQLTRDDYHVRSGANQFSRAEVWNTENITTYVLNDKITLKNIFGYRNVDFNTLEDFDGEAAILLDSQRIASQDQFSWEFQVQGETAIGNWIAGVFYFREKAEEQARSVGLISGAGASPLPISQITENADVLAAGGKYANTAADAENVSKAIFLQDTFKLDDLLSGLSATIGVRQNFDDREAVIKNRFDGQATGPNASSCRFFNAVAGDISYANCALPLRAKYREPTYNLSLDWRVNPDMLLYAATRHGYRTGGFGARATTVAGLQRTFLPEKVDDVELGIKADWRPLGTFLRTNLAVYSADYKDIQRLLTDSSTLPITTVTTNAGKAKIEGAEFEFIFRPNDWLEFSGFYSYTDARFTQFLGPDGIDRKNVPFARAPQNISNISARVKLPVPETVGSANIGVSYSHQDAYNSSDAYDPRFPAASNAAYIGEQRDLVDFDGEWAGVFGSNLDLSFFVKNAFENEYLKPFSVIVTNPAAGTGILARTPGEPRVFGLRAKYHLGN